MENNFLSKRKNIKEKIIVIVSIVLACAIITVATYSAVVFFGQKAILKEADAYNKIENRGLIPIKDELGYYTFTLPENDERPFTILQLTDLHLRGTVFSKTADKSVYSAVYKLLENVKPDLVIFTGDVAMSIESPLFNLVLGAKTIGTFMENIGIPWTLTYGNHDTEGIDSTEKSTVSAYLESLEHCIFQKGSTFKKINNSWAPEGNTFINILNSDGSHNTSLALIDSNMRVRVKISKKYDNIHDDQTEWYERELIKLADKYTDSTVENLKTLAFYHIPNVEFNDAYKLYLESSSEVAYIGGEINEPICTAYYKDNLFEKMVNLKSTKGIFLGHDHTNNITLKYRGIVFSYGLSLRYKVENRGGTVITLQKDEVNNLDFKIKKILLSDID